MLTAGPRGQFPRWRRSRKRLSVCSVLRCRHLWLQYSVSFMQGLEKTHHAVSTSERTAGSAWETWTVAAADSVGFARVRWEINFLLTFETAPLICKHPVMCGFHVAYFHETHNFFTAVSLDDFDVLSQCRKCFDVVWFILTENSNMIPKKYSIKDYRIHNTELYGKLCYVVSTEYTD